MSLSKDYKTDIGLVILGCGYMGGTGIRAYQELQARLNQEDVDLDLLFVVERDTETFAKVASFCHGEYGYSPLCFPRYHDSLEHFKDHRGPIIIYDATPPHLHFGHYRALAGVARVNGSPVYYLGEKPLFLDPQNIVYAEELPVTICSDLIETRNAVFINARNYISGNQLKIQRMWFWRAGSTGLKKMAHCGRSGVQGGALLDKSAHDLSISMNLLGPTDVTGEVNRSKFHTLLLGPLDLSEHELPSTQLLSVMGLPMSELSLNQQDRLGFPADGISSFSVDWQTQGRVVPTEYLCSWFGVVDHPAERPFRDTLASLGLSVDEFLVSAKTYGPTEERHPLDRSEPEEREPLYEIDVREMRVGIIECLDRTLVCSFLAKDRLPRRVVVIFNDGRREEFGKAVNDDYGALKAGDLSYIFEMVVRDALGTEKAEMIGPAVSLEVTRLMLNAQSMAVEGLQGSAFDDELAKAMRWSEGQVRRLG